MNAERLAEIRKWADDPTLLRIGPTVLRELLDHIAQLEDWKAQESQVLDGLQLQEIGQEIGVQIGHDIGPAILPWIRAAKAQLEAQRGGAVVVAELPKFDPAWELSYSGKAASIKEQQAFANGYQFAMHKAEEVIKGMRTVDASQVLQPGMVGVDRDYLADLEEAVIDTVEQLECGFVMCENCGEQEETKTLDVMSMHLVPMKARIDALRSQAGGEG